MRYKGKLEFSARREAPSQSRRNAVTERAVPTRCHSEPVTDVTGVRISRMKGTAYRPAPKISPLYEQSMGGHRSPVPFNRGIPTAGKRTASE